MSSTAQHSAPQPQQPPKKRKPIYKRWWVWVIAVIVLIGIANAAGGDDSSSGTSAAETDASTDAPAAQEPAAPPAPAEQLAQIGESARDGQFEFVVNGVECGVPSVGSSSFGHDAQGEFCIVNVTVTNIGDEPQGFFGDNAKLINVGGQEFSADTSAAIYMSDNADAMYAEINPGNTITTDVVFDVPVGTDIDQLELHDSAFSGGVKVQV